jgi:cyclophilin family peptidyl-prolyl cis-trans isomerase
MANTKVILDTSKGKIEIELNDTESPLSVANFLQYVNSGFYSGTIFHRVIPGFMIQGGGMQSGMKEKKTEAPVKNEAGNGLKNLRGTLAFARTQVVDSATSQFFINLKDNGFLDHQDESIRGFGYCVFGRVTAGMDIVDGIARVATGSRGFHENVPEEDVLITSATVLG